MAFHFLLIFALLNLAFAGSNATLTKEELHWISVFPHTPMPKVLQDILPQHGRGTIFRGDISLESGGENDPEPNKKSKGRNASANKDENDESNGGELGDTDYGFSDYTYMYSSNESRDENATAKKDENDESNGGELGDTDYGFSDYTYMYSSNESKDENASATKGSVKESRGDDSPNNTSVNDSEVGNYTYHSEYKDLVKESKGSKNSLGRKSNPDKAAAIKKTIYFFQKDLLPGTKVNLPRLIHKRDGSIFLPKQIAESMPLSSDKLPKILKNFSLKAESRDANNVKTTVKNCERAEMKGEEKYCSTSLESFVDSGVSMLGKNIQLLYNELGKETNNPLFTIGRGVRNMGENDVVCHKMKYPYAVYFCHSIKKTVLYKVPLVGMDGIKANAVAVCHKDTSAWSPNHIAFQILKVKPGTVPICHFLDRDTIVWVRN